MNVVALTGGCGDPAYVLTIFHHGVACTEIHQRNLVTDGNIVVDHHGEIGIILGYNAPHFGTGFQVFNNDNADIVTVVMDKKMRFCHSDFLPFDYRNFPTIDQLLSFASERHVEEISKSYHTPAKQFPGSP